MVAQSAINHTVGDLHAVGLGEGPRALVTAKRVGGGWLRFKVGGSNLPGNHKLT